ncbi:MAG: M48 family metalloprotease, partial [Terriglobales bacterium]
PVDIYCQEQDQPTGYFRHVNFTAQTRFWGYALSAEMGQSSATEIVADRASAVSDRVSPPAPRSPLGREREWEYKAENDVLRRMQTAGLLAPAGPVDAVLTTVVHNLEATNRLAFDPPVRCRVLLTSPLESFTAGHTIVLSRGLIDVLPDEASLAMILAHELGHIALDHGINTAYAFDDQMMFPDAASFRRLRLADTPGEEAAADAKGLAILEHSPYREHLAAAGLFLEALQQAAAGVPNLISAHLGNSLVLQGRVERMQALLARAPELQVRNLHQIPALALGSRIALNPWNDQLQLLPQTAEQLLAPRDKLSFEITPLLPWLARDSH